MSIKAVAFDYGGVISHPQDDEVMQDLASLAGIDSELMRRIYWENRPIYDQGLVSGQEYFRNILADIGVFPDANTIEALLKRDIKGWSRINEKTVALMEDLKKAGIKVGILSNMVEPFLEMARVSIPVFSLPDSAVYSCEVDTVKPEKKIYQLLLEALDCEADELVFFDDMRINVEAAEKLGIHAFIWKGPEEACKELKVLCAGKFL
jgi:putative hydrolase of the HAD superfamily